MGKSINSFAAGLKKVNGYLAQFPDRNQMDPTRNCLNDDKIIAILHNAIAMHWQQEMAVHNFDLLNSSLVDFYTFCYCLEHSSSLVDPQDVVFEK